MKSFNDMLSKIEQYFIGLLLLAVAFLLFANVILRLFGSSIIWAEEVARYAIVWLTFIGSSVCIYKGAHIGVDAIMNILSDNGKKFLTIITILMSLIFTILFTYYAVIITQSIFETKQVGSTVNVPIAFIYASMPVGGILMTIRYAQELILTVREGKN